MKPNRFPFPHTQLDAFVISKQMVRLANELAARVPRGHRKVADHLKRAASNTALLIGEGANRFNPAGKRQRYSEARGEAGEVAAAVELCDLNGWGSEAQHEQLLELAGRVGAMLTKLLHRFA